MSQASRVRTLLLRDTIYQTLSREEKCLVALEQLTMELEALYSERKRGNENGAQLFQEYKEFGSSSL